MTEFRSRVFRTASAGAVENLGWRHRKLCANEMKKQSGLEEAGGDAIVAVELHVIERSGDSIPSGHGCGLVALHVGSGGQNYIAVPHRFTNENDLDLERRSNGERPRAEEIHAG